VAAQFAVQWVVQRAEDRGLTSLQKLIILAGADNYSYCLVSLSVRLQLLQELQLALRAINNLPKRMVAAYIDPMWSFYEALVALRALAYFKSYGSLESIVTATPWHLLISSTGLQPFPPYRFVSIRG
jgi:hypothetical protein